MKLSQLYASGNFKAIKFNDGLNIVIASVKSTDDRFAHSHNLGKSTLVSLIDFMLLKQADKNSIFIKNHYFKSYVFFLEIVTNRGKFITIQRSIEDYKSVSIKISEKSVSTIDNSEWDYSNIPVSDAIELLNSFNSFDDSGILTFRGMISYFLRSQNDFNDVFKLSKHFRDEDWKPLLFSLLGFNGNLLKSKYILKNQIDNMKNTLDSILSINPDYSIESLDLVKNKISDLESKIRSLSRLNFFENERELVEKISSIDDQILNLHTIEYKLLSELKRVDYSLREPDTIDLDELKTIFAEVNIYFSDALIRDYDSLVFFNQKMVEQRNLLLKNRRELIVGELGKIRGQIFDLNNERAVIVDKFFPNSLFNNVRDLPENLEVLQSQLNNLLESKGIYEKIFDYQRRIEIIEMEYKDVISLLKNNVFESNPTFSSISNVYSSNFREITGVEVLLNVYLNKLRNVTFESYTISQSIELTSESLGSSFKKLMCALFDLSVLIIYSQSNFFRFAFHDGVFEGLDNRIKEKYFDTVKRFCTEFGIQYIFTAIEHDIPSSIYPFISDDMICLRLSDSGPDGKLFLGSF